MKVVATTKSVTQPEPVTVAKAGEILCFSVQAGIPLDDALNDLYIILDAACDGVESIACGLGRQEERSPAWSIVRNLEFAKTLLQAIHGGYIQHRQHAEG